LFSPVSIISQISYIHTSIYQGQYTNLATGTVVEQITYKINCLFISSSLTTYLVIREEEITDDTGM
jgi:hypothetical protein